MKNSWRLTTLTSMALLVGACAHHRDVRPGADGKNRVVTTATENESASRNAISQANHFCGQFKQSPRIISEKTIYTGEMNEDTRKTIRKASQAAVIIGGMNTNTNNNKVNPILGAGTVGGVMTNGEDYQTEMIFECK